MTADRQYSKHQKDLIRRYYENRDDIMTQRLGDLITDIYLCESPRKLDHLWDRVRRALSNMNEHQSLIDDLIERRDLKTLAEIVGAKF